MTTEKNKLSISAKINLVLFAMLFLSVFYYYYLRHTSWLSETLFAGEQDKYEPYFNDDFEGYEQNSEILNAPLEDLSRWRNEGSVTAWTDISDWKAVDRVDLILTDSSGRSAILKGIENIKSPRENNQIKSDDEFPDYNFSCQQNLKEWEDFMLVNGRNFLFWEYAAPLGIDMSEIVSWKAVDGDTYIPVTDVVIHDGLCRDKNSLAGNWYSPNGLAQYGVWWPDQDSLIMENVEQEQYPSNGDHARILSAQNTPKNFILRTRFKIVGVKDAGFIKFFRDKDDSRENTYIRIAWDFDNEYDPGHDQMLVFNSLEYGYLGIQRVYPLVRYTQQNFEPEDQTQGRTRFSFKDDGEYEVNVKVAGQKAEVEVYEIGRLYTRRVARAEYEFIKKRLSKAYPFSIETTGNIGIVLRDFEVMKLKE